MLFTCEKAPRESSILNSPGESSMSMYDVYTSTNKSTYNTMTVTIITNVSIPVAKGLASIMTRNLRMLMFHLLKYQQYEEKE